MKNPVYVTEIVERKPDYATDASIESSLELWNDERWGNIKGLSEWWAQFKQGSEDFAFRSIGSPGYRMYYQELIPAVRARDSKAVRSVLRKMKKYRLKLYRDLTVPELWARTARRMPEDIAGPKKREITALLTSRAQGRVLETMCGFNSYFAPSEQIREVIALDYCREMLERYEYPERKRILFDIERVVKGERMDFFRPKSFQTIGCWGSNYLSDPMLIFAEFRRLLSEEGTLVILENTEEGYRDSGLKRLFDPKECAMFMEKAGLSSSIEHQPQLRWNHAEYYLVTGRRVN